MKSITRKYTLPGFLKGICRDFKSWCPFLLFLLGCFSYAQKADAQISIGSPGITDGASFSATDITDSLTAGYSVAWVTGNIRNQYSSAYSVSCSFTIDGTTAVASEATTVYAGSIATVYKSVSPARVLAAGTHTISSEFSALLK